MITSIEGAIGGHRVSEMPPQWPAASGLRVGLNLIYLVPGETGGTETYARELIPALLDVAPSLRLTAFVNRETAAADDGPWGELIPAVTVPVRARNRLEWVRGEQALLPGRAAAAGVDLVHSLGSTAPSRGRFLRVTTIHDLHYRTVPEAHFGLLGLGMRMLVPLAARRSDRILADSYAVRDQLVELLHLPAQRIDVVPLGTGTTPTAPPMPAEEVRRRHGIGEEPILLTVSAKRPHKNLSTLLDALARLPPERRPVLVMPGYPTPHEQELRVRARELGLESHTRFPPWTDDGELEGLYAAAAAFVFPSLSEGFGLPVLEAMRRGVPVACSNNGAVAEVADEAALLFDPGSPRSIAEAIERLLTDREYAERLKPAGRRRAAEFTWERTARATLASYERALGDGLSGRSHPQRRP
jgi:glycosyltransferase involved in cell wall biosynthesis